jgi:hypothetical protein
MGIVRDLALLVHSIGHGFEQFRRANGDGARERTTERADNRTRNAGEPVREPGDDFLLACAIGFNQRVLSNIDATDTALIGILGATGAFTVLTVDKIRELAVVSRWIAIALLASSALASLAGYAYGFIGGATRDVPRPLLFVPDFSLDSLKAIARAIRETVLESEENLRIRRRKRVAALLAIALLIAGAVVVSYARVAGTGNTML